MDFCSTIACRMKVKQMKAMALMFPNFFKGLMKFRNFSKKRHENFGNEFGGLHHLGFGNPRHHGEYELSLQLGVLCDHFWSGFGSFSSVSRTYRGL